MSENDGFETIEGETYTDKVDRISHNFCPICHGYIRIRGISWGNNVLGFVKYDARCLNKKCNHHIKGSEETLEEIADEDGLEEYIFELVKKSVVRK